MFMVCRIFLGVLFFLLLAASATEGKSQALSQTAVKFSKGIAGEGKKRV